MNRNKTAENLIKTCCTQIVCLVTQKKTVQLIECIEHQNSFNLLRPSGVFWVIAATNVNPFNPNLYLMTIVMQN